MELSKDFINEFQHDLVRVELLPVTSFL